MAKISIIIPVYNTEKYLPRCIESILNQTFSDFEVICVNDGSTDNSGIICDEYANKDKRIRVIHQRNSGVSAARNLGLDNATGDFICFVDSDDYVAPSLLKDNSRILISKSADIVCFNYCEVCGGVENIKYEYTDGSSDIDILIPFLKGKSSRGCCNRLFRATIWETLRFPVNLPFAEDWFALSQAYTIAKKIVGSKGIYYFYNRDNTGSITHTVNLEKYYYDFYTVAMQVELFKGNGNYLQKLVMKHSYRCAFKVYNINVYKRFLDSLQENELKNFIENNKNKILEIYFMDKLFLISYYCFPIVNFIKGYISYRKIIK